jgi:hypothetical protein
MPFPAPRGNPLSHIIIRRPDSAILIPRPSLAKSVPHLGQV